MGKSHQVRGHQTRITARTRHSYRHKRGFEKHNLPYRVEPVSILDIQRQRVEVDAQGYPKHVMLNEQKRESGDGSN